MSETMERLSHAVGWASYVINLAWALWFGIGVVVSGVLLAHDEWRLYRARPKPREVQAYADHLVLQHGREAFRVHGDAMIVALHSKQLDQYRFFKEVSGELAARLAMQPSMDLESTEDWWRLGTIQGPPSR